MKNEKLQVLRSKMGFEGLFTVEPVGRRGGLALLWRDSMRDSMEVDIMNYSLRHINAGIILAGSKFTWKLTCFYRHPDCAYRTESWNLLSHLSSLNPRDWLCVGDFNDITSMSDKFGGAIRNETQMACFRSTLADCMLGDLGFKSSKYTCSNRRDPNCFVNERLERALASVLKDGVTDFQTWQWRSLQPEHLITTLYGFGSIPTSM